jgi:hypothetical protein
MQPGGDLRHVKETLMGLARQHLRPLVPKRFRRRVSVIGPGGAFNNPFQAETVARWFSSETQMDSQLRDIALRFQQNPNPRPSYQRISQDLFGVDCIYQHYQPVPTQPEGAYATHIQPETLERVVRLLGGPPTLGIEVGSYVGHGACRLGEFVKQHHGVLLCVDTWCGDVNMWLGQAFASTMGKQDGNPDLYHHFMRRIMAHGLEDTIIPVRVSSVVAARMFRVMGYQFDFVYLDSAHEAGETFLEMNLYFDLLRPGGVLLGDDFGLFPAVNYDVRKFLEFKNLKAQILPDRETWIIHKPAQTQVLSPSPR